MAAWQARNRLAIPTANDVQQAIAVLPRHEPVPLSSFGWRETRQSVRTYDGARYFLECGPGIVRVRRRFTAPREHFGHTDDMTMLDDKPTRGVVAEWSEESRNRMTATFQELDYGPMFEDGRAAALVTLTLPGDWERYVPSMAAFKKMVNRFAGAYGKAWGEPLRAIWKMEFQRRGAPHLHILMCPPSGLSNGRGVTRGLRFHNWASLRWTQIVGTAEGSRARRDHQLAGVDVDYGEVRNYSDPRRIGQYFSKHGRYTAKEYQNEMPAHWRAAILAGECSGGLYWGRWGLEKLVEVAELHSTAPASHGRVRTRPFPDEPTMHRHRQPVSLPDALGNDPLCQPSESGR